MDPRAKYPVSAQAMRQFLSLTKPQDMVSWNKKHTPWIFQLGDDIQKALLKQYQDQIDGQGQFRKLQDVQQQKNESTEQQKE